MFLFLNKKKENFSSFPHQVQPMARRRRKTNFVFLDYVEPGNNGEINGTVRQKLSSLLGRFHGEPWCATRIVKSITPGHLGNVVLFAVGSERSMTDREWKPRHHHHGSNKPKTSLGISMDHDDDDDDDRSVASDWPIRQFPSNQLNGPPIYIWRKYFFTVF